ncbi:TPA: hypothetical protein L3V69_003086 [Vibrio parahaemolyticus]|uniref:hypothetical protein n=1 Tax=Vibrio parahaemolyticus TaxID=670 RepID=UPI00046FAAFB|nr:hypothetical protein [Vibrio parahaemolyticus]EGQ8248657.1 hypothetical protein [Vibrio parahaemolyticus]EGQ8932542.1 hypothetical protein [Vibrio parahaemolyticus]EGQ8977186.1 hypothetical protein [Vibrio parahaemolyticus]EGQ8982038.1 hypothetical protein [Vibrio parahaemolyticus]EGQ9000910.1 hypothetical protein [Vibrio parahaemolyticus]
MLDDKNVRIIYSFRDFSQALSALTFLLDDFEPEEKYTYVELRRFRCFETTLIISMARPFEQSRGSTTISLKNVGIKLNKDERFLVNKVCSLRKKVIAHSDQDEMHFYLATHELENTGLIRPDIRFDESLYLTYQEFRELEILLRKLKNKIYEYVFDLAQEQPEVIEFYKKPKSWDNKA